MKRLLSFILVFLIIFSVVAVSVSAKEIKSENVLHFDANTVAPFWVYKFERIYCHIWEYEGESFYRWQSIRELCTDEDKDGIWTYDLDKNGIELEDGKLYAVIFSNENGKTVYDILFDTTVLGDTAYCDGTYYDSPEETEYYFAYWRNQGRGLYDFGPTLYISSIGNVVGTCIPNTKTQQKLFEDFLINKLENARVYSGKDDQPLVDDLGLQIELTIYDALEAIDNTNVKVEWSWWESTLEYGKFTPALGDVDGDTTLSIMDATLIQQYKAEIFTIPEKLLVFGDVDKDAKVSVLDATEIQLILAQLV
ncbi:MAG: dockerin type I repeat-containing protein [Ruminococcus sp.]|nr:dockerin type I repeat-containing protein [Ruminococcus sp.]